MEDRWLRLIAPGIISLGLLAAIGSNVGAVGSGVGAHGVAQRDAVWVPPRCDGGAIARIVAARAGSTASVAQATPVFALVPVVDATGTLTGQRLTLEGTGERTAQRLDLPPESFAAGPFGRVVLVGDDDGRTSNLTVIDLVAGCAWAVAEETAVIRRATIGPDGMTIYETRVDRASRADLGVWRRSIDGSVPVRRILDPMPPDGRFGRTWSTEFSWSVDGDRLAVQTCGAVACRTRVLEPVSGHVDTIADPTLGVMVGLTRDRLVTYRACRGYPCGLMSVDPVTGRGHVLSPAAGPARIAGHGAATRIVHEWRDATGQLRSRSLDPFGGHATDIGAVPEVSR